MTAHFTGTSGTPDSTTAYYMGGAYEVKDGAAKKYYSIAGMMVAVKDGTAVEYRLTDHLGSTVAVTNASSTLTSQQRYLPFGGARSIPNSPIAGTDFTYTGQRMLDSGMGGIMDYRARFYSPYLNQFTQPDTIVSDPYNPQAWNRYAYVLRNPIRYNDPTGHVCSDPEDPTPTCYGSAGAQTRVGDRMIRGNGAELGKAKNKPDKVEHGDNSCGQQGKYSSRCPGWHFYTTTNLVCPAELQCTEEEMKEYFLQFAYPGQNPAYPVADEGNYVVGYPFTNLPMQLGWGEIVVDLSPNGLISTNTTQPSHILYDGKITRHAYQAENGAWYVSTYGSGNNVIHTTSVTMNRDIQWSMAWTNETMGVYIFNDVDKNMLAYILENH